MQEDVETSAIWRDGQAFRLLADVDRLLQNASVRIDHRDLLCLWQADEQQRPVGAEGYVLGNLDDLDRADHFHSQRIDERHPPARGVGHGYEGWLSPCRDTERRIA